MNQYRVAPAARSDLDDIWFYIAQDNPDAADKFVRVIFYRLMANGIEIARVLHGARDLPPLFE